MGTRLEKSLSRWLETHLGGHVSFTVPLLGWRAVLYGFNAMHVALNVWVPPLQSYVCFHPPMWCFGHWWPWKFYVSRNATPWAAWLALGPGIEPEDREGALIRRVTKKCACRGERLVGTTCDSCGYPVRAFDHGQRQRYHIHEVELSQR